ncbi:MAG: SDR family NAD(P)-dependent oxidoreductase [Pseudobdellovibrionaceae bacterium]|uniref:SDR family NAD(P)-dependent oxidoreductase n=1 Tax=Oligoflexus sp. TaxID=1971216 RepID=UPI0027C017A4|nr:SDR family NAD(P)-dependent oxidoreductase [Oligoflexus sp.]MDQ3231463.1 SDR family NAD(P)-dependent oxidoreductase [Pseudobdellovibrionaceae bacterium]HYX36983.1 SDR family NAD(P)-dependent oxidoreductase [Oligoflexus sp.]
MKPNEHLVIITGHSSGLGRALLDLCLQDKTHVLGIARRRVDLLHPCLKQIQADLSDSELRIEQSLQPLDAFLDASVWRTVTLINNAGTAQPISFMGQLDAQAIASSLHINLTVPLQLSNWLLQRFPQQRLRIAQISSGASKKAYPGWGAYCSSKAGLRMAAQVLAAEAELSGRDLRVLIYEPGVLDTPMQEGLRQTRAEDFPQVDRFRQMQTRGELVAPTDSARELWRLLSNKEMPSLLEIRYGDRA